MKMMFVGDPHGRYEHILDAVLEEHPECCIMVGDQCFETPVDQLFVDVDEFTELRWIHGNHDTDRPEWHTSLFGSPWSDRNLHGRVESIAGISIAGLGGVFRESIWHPDAGIKFANRKLWEASQRGKKVTRKELRHESTIWPNEYEKLAMQRADILVLHDAPGCHRYGFTALSELAEMLGVRLVVHGHHHEQYCDILDSGIAVVGLGLAQVAWFDLEEFEKAQSAEEIINGFHFGMIATRNGGWMY